MLRKLALLAFLIPGKLSAIDISGADHPDRIPDQYIVHLKSDTLSLSALEPYVVQQAERIALQYDAHVLHEYSRAIVGLAVKVKDIDALLQDPYVEKVEANKRIYLQEVQAGAPWGLDRIDARVGLDGNYNFNRRGNGVHVYIIDTGIRASHSEFAGRIGLGATTVFDGRGADDCNGHGTHVAGTVGGSTFGVAKGVILHPIRVLGCLGDGSDAGVVAGVEWMINNAQRPAVANMSLGGGLSDALDRSIANAVRAGIFFIVAAGNNNTDACYFSPSRVREAITVGATGRNDSRASFSNYGSCVDIFAPGEDILSASFSHDHASQAMWGTSMAAPHVAGVAALLREERPHASVDELTQVLLGNGTTNVLQNLGWGSPNRFLFSQP